MKKGICIAIYFSIFIGCKEKDNSIVITEYYSNGNIKSETPFSKDSLKDGFQKFYFPNGEIDQINYWSKGHIFGESFTYYPSGKIQTFRFYGLGDGLIYIQNRDQSGAVTREEGSPVLLFYNRDKIVLNGVIELKVIVGLFQTWNYNLKIKKIHNNIEENVEEGAKLSESFGHSIYVFREKCTEIGKHSLLVNLVLQDSITKRSIKYLDTLNYTVIR